MTEPKDRYPLFSTKILWDVRKGISKKTTYYSDGTVEEELVPDGPILMVDPLVWE